MKLSESSKFEIIFYLLRLKNVLGFFVPLFPWLIPQPMAIVYKGDGKSQWFERKIKLCENIDFSLIHKAFLNILPL